VARNQATPASDIDILIEPQPNMRIGLFDYVGMTHYMADLFPVPVDVANKTTLAGAAARSAAAKPASANKCVSTPTKLPFKTKT
jgi:predicted nucleotidyltransferase